MFETSGGWVIDDRIFIFGKFYPFNVQLITNMLYVV